MTKGPPAAPDLALLNRAAWRDPRAYDAWLQAAAVRSQEIVAAERGRTDLSFDSWLYQVDPSWPWHYRHLQVIRERLARVATGECRRLMIFLHPRSYKSEMVTIRFPAYMLERDPRSMVMVVSYNTTLAIKFSRKTRRIVEGRAVRLDPTRQSVDDWYTAAGGGLRAAGIGGGVTGHGARLCIVDDPVKSRAEANSLAFRDRAYEWFTDDVLTRLEPKTGAVVLVMTRWHEDDLAGRILKHDGAEAWEVLRIPALAETQEERDRYADRIGRPPGEPDPLGRLPGQAMNPERFDMEALHTLRREMGIGGFTALYQNWPTAPEGEMFRREWFEIVPGLPETGERRLVRYWDKAGSRSREAAYTAGVLLAVVDGAYYVVDCIVGKWEAGERERVIRTTAAADFARYGEAVETGVEQEPGSGGLESADNTVRGLAGYRAFKDRPTGDKTLRAEPLAAQAAIRNVKLVAGGWNGDYIDYLTAFPNGPVKDPIDASSGAFARLALHAPRRVKPPRPVVHSGREQFE